MQRPVEINRQTGVHTCNLDDSCDPVDFTGQDCVRVQDLHLHPDIDVIPLGTQRSLRVGGQTFPHGSLVCCVSRAPTKGLIPHDAT